MHQLCQEGFVRAFFVILLQLRGLRLVVGSKYDVKSWCSHWLASHRCHPHLAKNHFYTGFLHEDSWGSIDVIFEAASATAKLLQSCPTLCNPIDSSPLGSPVPGILQARILEWVAISFSNAWKWKAKEIQICRADFWTQRERERVGWFGRMALKHVYYHVGNKSQSMSNAGYSMLGAGAGGWPREMLWGVRWEGGSCLGTHVHPWWIHVNVWQNQYSIVK